MILLNTLIYSIIWLVLTEKILIHLPKNEKLIQMQYLANKNLQSCTMIFTDYVGRLLVEITWIFIVWIGMHVFIGIGAFFRETKILIIVF